MRYAMLLCVRISGSPAALLWCRFAIASSSASRLRKLCRRNRVMRRRRSALHVFAEQRCCHEAQFLLSTSTWQCVAVRDHHSPRLRAACRTKQRVLESCDSEVSKSRTCVPQHACAIAALLARPLALRICECGSLRGQRIRDSGAVGADASWRAVSQRPPAVL